MALMVVLNGVHVKYRGALISADISKKESYQSPTIVPQAFNGLRINISGRNGGIKQMPATLSSLTGAVTVSVIMLALLKNAMAKLFIPSKVIPATNAQEGSIQ